MTADYRAGLFDAIVCWDLDRLTRQPRQLEDWIDAAEDDGLAIVTANGEADLGTDSGRLFARIKAATARSEVERLSARAKRKNMQKADSGHFTAGRRPYGYTADEKVIPKEAEVVRAVYEAFLRGTSIKAIVRALNGKELVTGLRRADAPFHVMCRESNERRRARGVEEKPLPPNRWSHTVVRNMLRNPRYAGYVTYGQARKGYSPVIRLDANGEPLIGQWQPIVSPDIFAAAQAVLDDPARRTNRDGTERRHLGTGLYRCGVCGAGLKAGKESYACRGHLSRAREPLDDYVLGVARAELAVLAADPLRRPIGDSERECELRAVIERARRKVDRVQRDYDEGLVEARDLKRVRERAEAEIAEASAELTSLVRGGVLSPILLAEDPVGAFDRSDLAAKRSAIASLIEVVVLPVESVRYGRAFNPEYVSIRRVSDGSEVAPPQRGAVAGKTCAACNRPMLLADGCTRFVHAAGKRRARIPVGGAGDPYEGERYARCSECNAAAHHCHHLGCSKEVCPACGGRLSTCGCANAVG